MMLRAAGFAVIVTATLVRLVLPVEPLPYWDADPTVLFSPSSALGPAHSLALDVLTWLGAAVGLAGSNRAFGRPWVVGAALAVVGIAGAAWHGLVYGGGGLDDLRIGSNWAAAVVGAMAAFRLARDRALGRVAVALLIGAVGLLAAKGAAQWLIEHPTTVAMFRETREQFFQAQGWSPDSSSARAFERRLGQPEATGWFGLSNVYASVAATAAVALCGVTLVSWGRATRRRRLVLALGSAVALGAVVMSVSKGGVAATAIGLALVLALWLLPRRSAIARRVFTPGVGGLVGLLAVVGPLAAVVARGLAGDRLGELSLRFRWFYMQGAARIFSEHPGVGVGPAGFKSAYLIAKPPISPEEVTSPHSVIFDWAGTLGLTGLAWAGLWVGLVYLVGRRLFADGSVGDPGPGTGIGAGPETGVGARIELRVIALIVMIVTLAGSWFDAPAATIDSALVRLGGAAVWIAISAAVSPALRSPRAWPMVAAGATALAAHAQVEVTPIWAGTACWVMLLLASLAAPGESGNSVGPQRGQRRWPVLGAVAVLLAGATGLAWFGLRPAWAWQAKLVAAAEIARPLAEFRQRFAAIDSGKSGAEDSPALLARDLSRELGRAVGSTEASIRHALAALPDVALARALENLRAADRDVPRHPGTLRAASKAAIQLALVSHESHDEAKARELADLAEELAFRATTGRHEAAASWSWLGTLRSARAKMLDDPAAGGRAIDAWLTAAGFDPYGLSVAVQLAEAYERRGDAGSAVAWAGKALDLNAMTRLDPLKGLGADQRASLARLAGGS